MARPKKEEQMIEETVEAPADVEVAAPAPRFAITVEDAAPVAAPGRTLLAKTLQEMEAGRQALAAYNATDVTPAR